jgi:hypothetical protein
VSTEHIEQFQVLLPAAQASHLRALADHEQTIAADLIRQWVCERLAQHEMPHDPLGGQHYPPNVIRLPYVR